MSPARCVIGTSRGKGAAAVGEVHSRQRERSADVKHAASLSERLAAAADRQCGAGGDIQQIAVHVTAAGLKERGVGVDVHLAVVGQVGADRARADRRFIRVDYSGSRVGQRSKRHRQVGLVAGGV